MPATSSTDGPVVRVLGPVSVADRKSLGALSANAVLSLALARSHTRTLEALVEDVWPLDPPAGARQALQTLISRLRSSGAPIDTVPGGYRIRPGTGIDLEQAERLARPATTAGVSGGNPTPGNATPRNATAGDATTGHATAGDGTDDELELRLAQVQEALALWAEPIGGGASNEELVREVERRAEAARRALTLACADTQLALGRPLQAIESLDSLTTTGLPGQGDAIGRPDDRAVALTMRALTAAGRSADALETFATYRRRLADELGADPSPALAQLNTELLQQGTANAATAPPPKIGLRRPATELVGRADALSALSQLLATHRLVSIVGVGGLGKTRLARELAARHEGAVVFAELAGLRDGADIDRAVASLTADLMRPVAGHPPETSPINAVVAALGQQPTLLVLDNCEHLLADAARLTAELLERVSDLRVLTTSRRALGLAGEVVYSLPPLASLDESGKIGPAVRLFMERARAVRPDADLPPEQVAELTERLDGLPLAIELAAARTRSMALGEIAHRLADRFALLTIGDPTAPERHRTLRAVIDWSWDLLTASQRGLGRRLSGFAGSFDADGALALARERPPTDVLDDLDALVAHSLLKAFDSPASHTTRYLMVQTVHEYCREQAEAAGEADLVRDALFAWGRELAHTMLDTMAGARREPLRVALQDEEDNIVAVMRAALAAGDTATAVAVYGAAGMWWTVQGSVSELVRLAGDVFELIRSEGVPAGSEQDACLALALIAFTQGFVRDIPVDADARPLLRRLLDSEARIVTPIRFVAELVSKRDRPDEVTRIADRAKRDPDPAVRALAALLMASLAENTGQVDEAIEMSLSGYETAKAENLAWLQAVTGQTIAGLYSEAGRPEEALAWIEIARLDLAHVGGRVSAQDQVQIEMMGALRRGDIAAARAALAAWAPEPGSREPETDLLIRSADAEIDFAAGDTVAAVGKYDAALAELGGKVERGEPWWLISAAASLAVRLGAGLRDDPATAAIVHDLREAVGTSAQISAWFADYPVTGTVALAFAAWYAATEPGSEAGPMLLALAESLQSRQDIPSLERSRQAEAMDPAALALAREKVAGMPPSDRLAAALALIASPRP